VVGWPQPASWALTVVGQAVRLSFGEVMAMRRYLLVLDMDLLAFDEELGEQPINYLLGRQEQDQEPAEVVVLSLPATGKVSSLELLLGAAATVHMPVPVKLPIAPQPDHDVNAAAHHRVNRAVRQLKAIGYQASGVIRDEELVRAVRAETRARHYDEVILATGRQGGTWLARGLHRGPVHQLRRRWGQRLVTFTPRPG
jgi:hypothetical protein